MQAPILVTPLCCCCPRCQAIAGLTALQELRSLAIEGELCQVPPVAAAVQALSSLQHLASLALSTRECGHVHPDTESLLYAGELVGRNVSRSNGSQ